MMVDIIGTEKPLWLKYPKPSESLKRKQFELRKRRGKLAENRFLSSGTFNGHRIIRKRIGRDFDVIKRQNILSPDGPSKRKGKWEIEVKTILARLSKKQKERKKKKGSRHITKRYNF